MIDEILARLDIVKRRFERALVVGAEQRLVQDLAARGIAATVCDPSPRRAARFGGFACDEDALTVDAQTHDLIIACGTLDTVADLPGALLLIRRALRPDGLLLACMAGAPSLATARAAFAAADNAAGLGVARMHRQIDVRAAGDLLVRAGFALPVADLEGFALSYATLGKLIDDLRAAAMTNVLAERHAVTRGWLGTAGAAFAAQAQTDGRVHETLSLLMLTGWAPSPDQPQPARRGSGSASLAEALRQRG